MRIYIKICALGLPTMFYLYSLCSVGNIVLWGSDLRVTIRWQNYLEHLTSSDDDDDGSDVMWCLSVDWLTVEEH